MPILLLVSLLLLVREAFATATISNSLKQNNEHLWYPLIALAEILAVVLYATPGLVPYGKVDTQALISNGEAQPVFNDDIPWPS